MKTAKSGELQKLRSSPSSPLFAKAKVMPMAGRTFTGKVMGKKLRLLDLCCRAGGCSMGYFQAGFEVVGVDILPQRDYPFKFHQADAFEFAPRHWREFDVIHASPHCQGYSPMRYVTKKEYPREIEQFREMLSSFDRPYVIENVEQAPLPSLPLFGSYSILLCGTMFSGLKIYRHRRFESNLPLVQPYHPPHVVRCAKQGRAAKQGQFVTVTGNCSGADYARSAMGIDWMVRDDLSQAIPPAYTELIGEQLIKIL